MNNNFHFFPEANHVVFVWLHSWSSHPLQSLFWQLEANHPCACWWHFLFQAFSLVADCRLNSGSGIFSQADTGIWTKAIIGLVGLTVQNVDLFVCAVMIVACRQKSSISLLLESCVFVLPPWRNRLSTKQICLWICMKCIETINAVSPNHWIRRQTNDIATN